MTSAPPDMRPPPPSPPPPDRHRLHRSAHDRMIGGVAGGIAETYGWDPALVRLAAVLLVFFGGVGALLYVVAWIVLPVADADGPPSPAPTAPAPESRDYDALRVIGVVLVALGAIVALRQLGVGFRFDVAVALLLIGGGIMLLLRSSAERDADHPPPIEPEPTPDPLTSPEADEPERAAAGGGVDTGVDTSGAAPSHAPDAQSEGPAGTRRGPEPPAAWAPAAAWQREADAAERRASVARARKPPPFLGPITFGALLVLIGGAALVDAADIVEVDPGLVAALGLLVIAAALLVGAWFGRARGLIALGVVVTLVAIPLVLIDVPLRGGIGQRDYRPTTIAALRDQYRLGIGQLVVDLRALDLAGTSTEVTATLGIGELVLIVPDDVAVDVSGHASAGEVVLFGGSDDGLDVDRAARRASATDDGSLTVDAEVGFGSLKVLEPDDELLVDRPDLGG